MKCSVFIDVITAKTNCCCCISSKYRRILDMNCDISYLCFGLFKYLKILKKIITATPVFAKR